ncbi:proline-tRNA ligase [Striga asiatica]|uniref:Proline-tRNA ligase n=1 Tax=Striga asiatica TaxID=4170 RepID=A0A5A7QJH9_STRAF|nr:proline-tRNA ligase [Striga asiatica]
MADTTTQLKRLRSEDPETSGSDDSSPNSKRQKPYGGILSLLDQDEDDWEAAHGQDLAAVFSALQQEISDAAAFDLDSPTLVAAEDRSAADGEDGEAESVMRRLLEASDDELGIPSAEEMYGNINGNGNGDEIVDGIRSGEDLPFGFVDNLWELEDVAANYYTMLQSELFI